MLKITLPNGQWNASTMTNLSQHDDDDINCARVLLDRLPSVDRTLQIQSLNIIISTLKHQCRIDLNGARD